MIKKDLVFIFDLDGTLTKQETLPVIADHFGIDLETGKLTEQTVNGNIPFVESFIRRTTMLGKLPVSEVNDLLTKTPIFEKIAAFIRANSSNCFVATGNFENWIDGLVKKFKCTIFASKGIVKENKIVKLTHILKKEDVVKKFQSQGKTVVFVGEGNNDAEAMRCADISIACGLVHYPSESVMLVADYVVFDENSFFRLLNQIAQDQKGKSVVLNCAGIGSRLGMGQTKTLIDINGKPLIEIQLEMIKEVEDIRIVVGFQAGEVIKTVLKKRKDVIFAYNHDYFQTKTGASYYLGARHGNEYAISWDGDSLTHPQDVAACLHHDGEFISFSDIASDEPVFVNVGKNNCVTSFSRERGDYEWVGPACLKKEKIKFIVENIYNQMEKHLPIPAIKIRACDIDTYNDYKRAKALADKWLV